VTAEGSERVLKRGNATDVHQPQHHGQRSVDERAVDDDVDVLEAVAKDVEAQRERYDGQREPPASRKEMGQPGKWAAGRKVQLKPVGHAEHHYQQPPQKEPEQDPFGSLSLGRRGNVPVAIYLCVNGAEQDHDQKGAPIGKRQLQNRCHQRDRGEDRPACPARDEPPVGK
jgi:hypothetical protein